ncbi:MAG: hypothetical protein WA705_29420 [Candidatus Ozemobacteraceae bacterium]
MLKREFSLVFFLVFLALFFSAKAEAGIPIPVGFGDQISNVYDLPDKDFGGKNIGYMYGSFRILFIPVITWGGKLVLYEKNSYADLKPEEIKIIEDKYGKMSRRVGLWIRFVNFLWIFFIPIALFVWLKNRSME